MSKIKLNDAITKSSFIGFIIAIFVFFFMNVEIDLRDETGAFIFPTELKFVLYILVMGILVILEIPRPGISKFMMDVFDALNDGRLTPAEKLKLIQSAKDNLFGQWADLSALVAEEEQKEEAKKEIDLTEIE